MSTLRLIYLIGTYPLLTTTFIDREIKIMRRWGVDLQVISMRHPGPDTPFSDDQRALQQDVIYLLPPSWSDLFLGHLYFALRRPKRFFGSLFYLLSRPGLNLNTRFKTLLHFGEGVYTAYLVRSQSFTEFHAHFLDRAATIALVAGRLLGKPFSLSIHAGADIYVNPVLLREKLEHARLAVTCTRYNKTHLQSQIGEDLVNKISCIPHGLDLSKYFPGCEVENQTPLILSVGQLAERKGFSQLIQACHILKERGYDFYCQIVGQGPQMEELRSLVNRLNMEDRITLFGALPHGQVIEKYRQASMFVLPCVQTEDGDVDGIPNVLAEAMASQLPVISTDISAIPEIVTDMENGLLVPPRDIESLSLAMASLLDDPSLRKRLALQGQKSITQVFDVEQNVRQFAETLWPTYLNPKHVTG